MTQVWVGIDAGKSRHHAVMIDTDGNRLLSRPVNNTEDALLELLTEVNEHAEGRDVVWATDLNQGGSA